ncbi:hypothetical protein CcI156_07885 [Frankia sp. CcI156]|uniref:ABC transporter related n=1 Tax=Frankia casuarinae (strain DSM 45818 / CECT 9043 / HFP020203 / CcI3) TaxID=106370 RepID=Q2JGL4_FRACC|nr:ABC transporter related [Frankia casuarinae]ETA03723.1 hypothetical protein CcI6DRAFT_00880 [Frankia sp. CcI6]KEZ37297.1 ABC transporter [Frankia sp. CeD]KFB05371.1 ABC transporter [Frankia sp. Allo2]ONH27380.1 hypothetical protein CcI156_07885 [Frankia sp. CcI156]
MSDAAMNGQAMNGQAVGGPVVGEAVAAGGLVVDGLTVSYPSSGGPAVAVDGVSLRVRPGETYGLVGESGCGKSTLAAALADVLPGGGAIDAGRIVLDGMDVRALSARERRRWRADAFAMVHQGTSSSLDPTVRVGAQVAEACRLAGLSRAEARSRAVELLGAVRLPAPATIARRWPHELSGGQQQRVGIAAALGQPPPARPGRADHRPCRRRPAGGGEQAGTQDAGGARATAAADRPAGGLHLRRPVCARRRGVPCVRAAARPRRRLPRRPRGALPSGRRRSACAPATAGGGHRGDGGEGECLMSEKPERTPLP